MEKFDVAICGYGPVGATLSLLLAKYNYKVLIIEKNRVRVKQLGQSIQMVSN